MPLQSERDKDIIKHLELFKVMSRDQLIRRFFNHCRSKVNNCNTRMKILRQKGYVKPLTGFSQNLHVLRESKLRPTNTMIHHHLKVVNTYLDLIDYGVKIDFFDVETIYDKQDTSLPRTDLLIAGRLAGKKALLFLEIQNNANYTKAVYENKIARYKQLANSDALKKYYLNYLEALGYSIPKTLTLIFIMNTPLPIEKTDNLKVLQFRNVYDFINHTAPDTLNKNKMENLAQGEHTLIAEKSIEDNDDIFGKPKNNTGKQLVKQNSLVEGNNGTGSKTVNYGGIALAKSVNTKQASDLNKRDNTTAIKINSNKSRGYNTKIKTQSSLTELNLTPKVYKPTTLG